MRTSSNPNLTEPLDLYSPLALRRQVLSHGMTTIAFLLTGLAILPLFAVLLSILQQGLPNLSLEALTSLPAPVGLEGVANGFANAILGTIVMVGLASLISIPLGVITAVYLAEFSRDSPAANAVRFIVTILSGVPSIVVGVFAYASLS
jgi:phosphate transport system permease protein